MKNPIAFTKEDIYMIVDMADQMESYEGMLEEKHKQFVDELINCLTPEEQEEPIVREYKETSKKYYQFRTRR